MLFIIILRFGPNRSQAGQWMAGHNQWIQQGLDAGVFLMAGALDNAQGGVVLAGNADSAEVQSRVWQDPFVVHGVVTAEVHAVTPSRLSAGFADLLRAAA
jgi:uncharacterized protein YciI